MFEIVPGTVFGGEYRIVKSLQEGGMGSLYIAEQQSTGVLRALKLMQKNCVGNPTMRRRFEQEARVSARIESDYIVAVLGAGVDEPTGIPWIAMELLQGEDLAHRLEAKLALPFEEAQEVFRQLCHAVGAAHRVGIVHRDLKPENIFLAKPRRDTELFTVKVLDFGIAKVIEDGRTQTGMVGTPLWMAPEQTSPHGRISPATDVWSLGLIAFTLLTGKKYWHGANRLHTSLPMLLQEIVNSPLEPASVRAKLYGYTKPLPLGFDAWMERCVVRDAAQRFVDAAEALKSFRAVCSGEVPSERRAAPGSPPALSPQPSSQPRNKTVLMLALFVLLAVVGASISFALRVKGIE